MLADEAKVGHLCAAVDDLGLARHIKVFHGGQGAYSFGEGAPGLRGWLERTSEQLTGTSQDRLSYTSTPEDGQYVVAVDLHEQPDERKRVARTSTSWANW